MVVAQGYTLQCYKCANKNDCATKKAPRLSIGRGKRQTKPNQTCDSGEGWCQSEWLNGDLVKRECENDGPSGEYKGTNQKCKTERSEIKCLCSTDNCNSIAKPPANGAMGNTGTGVVIMVVITMIFGAVAGW